MLTVLQVLCFIGYSIMYTIVYQDYNPGTKLTRVELYQWISLLILALGMVYFLWTSLKEKP